MRRHLDGSRRHRRRSNESAEGIHRGQPGPLATILLAIFLHGSMKVCVLKMEGGIGDEQNHQNCYTLNSRWAQRIPEHYNWAYRRDLIGRTHSATSRATTHSGNLV